jgi:hypothetical protein
MGSAPPAPTCLCCGAKRLNRNNATGLCQRCRQGRSCSICRAAVALGNPCPPCAATCRRIAAAHTTDFSCRPPAGQLAARLAYYESRARAGLDLFPAPDPLPGGVTGVRP